jgi:hypothetical protein
MPSVKRRAVKSALGHKATSAYNRGMSASPSRTDIGDVGCDVGLGPKHDLPTLFNRIASLRDEQNQTRVIHAKKLPRNWPATS